MGFLRIVEPGMLTTVQDLGREGFAALGVPRGGAADATSLRIANRLVGNDDRAPALEMTLTGGTFVFEDAAVVAMAGGEIAGLIVREDELPRLLGRGAAERLRAGEMLRVGPIKAGARTYLCVAGGVRVPAVMGSASTLLSCGFGGHFGRALRRDDRIEFGAAPSRLRERSLSEAGRALERETLKRRVLRVIAGAHEERFDRMSAAPFWNSAFSVSVQSDRMGLRLEGPAVKSPSAGRMVSEGMPPGAIEITEGGQPIMLMPDGPTTGGYPVIACVASVDLPVLGQLRPREAVRFTKISLDEARRLFVERERSLDREVSRP